MIIGARPLEHPRERGLIADRSTEREGTNMVRRHLRPALSYPLVLVRNDETWAAAAIRNFYGAVTVLAVILTYGAQKRVGGR